MAVRTEPSALADLVALLDLASNGPDRFCGVAAGAPGGRLFGGHVAGQALAAAVRTVDADRQAHSLHAYFLAPGDTTGDLEYTVERLRDGRSFSSRRVTATQRGTTLFTLAASFARPRPGQPEHQQPAPAVAGPEGLATLQDRIRQYEQQLATVESGRRPRWSAGPQAFDVRYVDTAECPDGYDQCVWLRADGALPADPALHTSLLAYVSDMALISTVLAARGQSWDPARNRLTSLDHAMWCHRPFRVDEWLLYAQRSPSSAGGRGMVHGEVYTRDGVLVASVAQEGVVISTEAATTS